MNKDWQKLLRPDVAAKYEATQEPGRYVVRALGYQTIDLRTLSVAEADELVVKQGESTYLKLRKVRRTTSAASTAAKGK
ncbi:hypothetical protein [Hymenobacter psychrotolerans]|uniref:Uncharacterized protein n=1 Tax=Hymenobacter psychrotolerans DSM 18569 TaxID=1121959 RepID=A0A1M6Z8D2_9BACT|nr:hypothetical protein [Hymenobacter psychrotolerans]SHL26653.1 hypothetical protein SAMN02746009_02453 [Hymenobacter psychrotolerans DSM 18569]